MSRSVLRAFAPVLVSASLLLLGAGHSHAATDDYIAEKSASFALKDNVGEPYAGCRAEVWIGKTATGWVEGATQIWCNGQELKIQTELTLYQGADRFRPDRREQCGLCSYGAATFSEPGSGGWCAFGWGWRGTGAWVTYGHSGSATVCV